MKGKINQYYNDFIKFLRSTDFSKAIVLTIAIILPVATFSELKNLEIGISLAMGCLLSSPSDVTGSFKHKFYGILAAAFLGSVSFMIAGYAAASFWTVIPMLLFMMFGVSYLSVYGFRASLVTFSGLLAVVLSFANISSGIEIWQKALLIGVGGLWYLFISTLWHFIRPQRATEQLLAETMELTASYLRLRVSLLRRDSGQDEVKKEIFTKQTALNEHHESLREILINSRKLSGNSGYTRKRLLIFIDLVDMLELAMANPIDYDRMKEALKDHQKELDAFADFTLIMASQLEQIALAIHKNSALPGNQLTEYIDSKKAILLEFRDRIDIKEKREALLLLRNLLDYQVKQAQKINNIDRILRNLEAHKNILYKTKEVRRFLTPQDYSFHTLATNFNFNSAIFRHSLRLAIVVLIGFLVGSYFSVQNSYWILLTIIVIMRPNYGLTKERTRKRIIGTLVGGAIAIAIVFITQNSTVYAVLAMFSLTMAFSLIQRNYTTAATFITLSIIFIYALLQPQVLNVIQYRILDTLVGAALAAFGNFIFWPKWELQNINNVISTSLSASLEYLEEIDWFYHKKDKLPVSYKLARKKAFLEIGNLSGAFQRMTQEPKSQQKRLGLLYEIVELNQTFLSALASMGTYIRTHPTTQASSDFETYSRAISGNLKNSINILEGKSFRESINTEISEAGRSLQMKFDELAQERNLQIEAGKKDIDDNMRHRLQEAHLITGQLEWLLDISEKLQDKVERLK